MPVFDRPEASIDPSSLALICGAVALMWGLIALALVLVSRTRRMPHAFRCPLLRRPVVVDAHEWSGRMLDVRACSGLRPSNDFALCGKNCLEIDEQVPVESLVAPRR